MEKQAKTKARRKDRRPGGPTRGLHYQQGAATAKRRFLKDLLLGLSVCFVFFGVIEAGLRIAGVPADRDSEDPYVGFSSIEPLFVVKNGEASTASSKLKYFNPVSFPVGKEPGTFRIFCFGGSTTYGRPYNGQTAFPRWLGELLSASAPKRSFQVINAGGISYASYRILPLVKEALEFEPDLVVIYTGHNEFLERRTYSGLLDQGRDLLTVRSALERLRVYRGLEFLIGSLLDRRKAKNGFAAASSDTYTYSTRKTVLPDEVSAILDRSAGPELYHRDEDFSRGVVRHFAHNLTRMIRTCKRADVPVILVEPACNLKGFSPFKSEHGWDVDAKQTALIRIMLHDSLLLLERKEFDRALALLRECEKRDPVFAMTHFQLGKALLGLGRQKEARSAFIRARDLDVCPLRATSPILKGIRQIAAQENVPVVRFSEVLAAASVKGGQEESILGDERFLDHVHPAIQGHQRLAEAIFGEILRMGLVRPSRRLGSAEKPALYGRVMDALDPAYLAERDWNLAKVLEWAGKRDEARAALLRAAKAMGSHPGVRAMLGSMYLDEGRPANAVAELKKAVEMSRNDPNMLYGLAIAYMESGNKLDAERTLELLTEGGAGIPEAYSKLAVLYFQSGRTTEALGVLKLGLRNCPESHMLLGSYALALADTGRPNDGIRWMLKALEMEPANPDYLYELAAMYALTGRTNDALKLLGEAVRNGYGNSDRLLTDSAFASIRNTPAFESILRRMIARRRLPSTKALY